MFYYIYGSVLGIIQGLTEFLPISSSGHLFVAQYLNNKFLGAQHFMPFASKTMPLLYVVLLHLATLCAVLLFTRVIIKKSLRACFQFCVNTALKKKHNETERAYVHFSVMVGVATTATLPLGLLLKNTVVHASLNVVITGFFITAAILCIPSILSRKNASSHTTLIKPHDTLIHISLMQALCIGLIQGCAVLPGISRSGSTIVAGLLLGLPFAHAAYFSFILAIPTILFSFFSSVLEAGFATAPKLPLGLTLTSMITAFLAGLIGLSTILTLARKQKLWIFSLYLIILNTTLLFINRS